MFADTATTLLLCYSFHMQKGIDYIGIAVCPFVHDGKGNYLFGKRTENFRDEHGCWEPTGSGGLKFGETIEDTLHREVKEELGADIKETEFIGRRELFREHEGKKTHWILFDYRSRVDPEQVKIMEPEMCAELRWEKFDEIPLPAYSPYAEVLKKYKDQLI